MEPLTMLALGSVAAGVGASIYNTYSQKKENEIMREREDNAISRRMRDLEASGLSPTLAAGSAASSQAGTAPNSDGSAFDFASKAISLMRGKSEIDKTNADAELAKFQATSEKFKQAYMQSQTDGENLRNSWINADMFSKLDLRDKQGQKIGEEMKNIVQDTALLKARTAYEQANKDFLMTSIDNEKIQRDLNNFNLTTAGIRLYNDVYKTNKGLLGNVAGDIRNLFTTPDIRSAIKNMDTSWYWENKR